MNKNQDPSWDQQSDSDIWPAVNQTDWTGIIIALWLLGLLSIPLGWW